MVCPTALPVTSFNSNEAMQIALDHHHAGRLADAERLCRQLLTEDPRHAGAFGLLASIARRMGRPDVALGLLERAIRVSPHSAELHRSLGGVFHDQGRWAEAVAAYHVGLRLAPEAAEIYNDLGNAERCAGLLEEAIASYREAIRLRSDFAIARTNLGVALTEAGQVDEGVSACREAAREMPGRSEERTTTSETPSRKSAFVRRRRRFSSKRFGLRPRTSRFSTTWASCTANSARSMPPSMPTGIALSLKPDFAEALGNLANALASTGLAAEALDCCNRAVDLKPHDLTIRSHKLCSIHMHPAFDAEAILRQSRIWNDYAIRQRKHPFERHDNSPEPGRKLRLGYVSPDFRGHVVGYNILPLLRAHDRKEFEIYCYACRPDTDAVTDEIRSLSNGWRSLVGVGDHRAERWIREDRIDILVDLALHSAGNRLPLFARKPAPIQVAYLGYCSTTGLEAIDYRLSDPFLDPPGSDLSCYSEETIRLLHSYWCYEPMKSTPAVTALPALGRGYVTFGCLNNFAKVSEGALDLWMSILREVPGSRLLLQAPLGRARLRVVERFAAGGIAKERLEFVLKQAWEAYLKSLSGMDLALDPFPYGGGITSCDALWMGVPVVSLSGRTAVGRGGRSILSNIGLPELVAETPEQYIEIAVALANDLPRLTGVPFQPARAHGAFAPAAIPPSSPRPLSPPIARCGENGAVLAPTPQANDL